MRSSLAGKVVRMGDAERRVVDAFTPQPAVTEVLPGFHSRKDMLDAGADLPVRAVVLPLPDGQFRSAVTNARKPVPAEAGERAYP
ncbi:hypothetical protein GCM10011583_44930 [Streptomyces camponoticapitis]|uniref:Uncharacterized protein n=1 Tax=Streptomyces camponoticapitis TaxID=1616125 RepID=A0ABQ2EDX4_9ACTN|nr:hypothetical protein GCM10011583_44930 [Streptomyces camponoticapitis]